VINEIVGGMIVLPLNLITAAAIAITKNKRAQKNIKNS
jgi:hypothetical protein